MHRQAGARRDSLAQERDRAAHQRDQRSDERDDDRDERDHAADDRDRAGDQRDQVANARDRAADQRDAAAERRDERAELAEDQLLPDLAHDVLRHVRESAASDRSVSAEDRSLNAADRVNSADARQDAGTDRVAASTDRHLGDHERELAEADRTSASQDRRLSAVDRATTHLDELTGAYRRGSGFVELAREVSRATRTREPLSVVFVDVDHLKTVNDSHGHAACDRLLKQVADVLKSNMRAYDLVMRYGGDEFVCVLAGMTYHAAGGRMARANRSLLSMPNHASISMGVAELVAGDTAAELVARADEDMYRRRAAERSASVRRT